MLEHPDDKLLADIEEYWTSGLHGFTLYEKWKGQISTMFANDEELSHIKIERFL